MLDAVQAFQGGGPAIGTGESRIPRSVCSFQSIVPKTADWRSFEASYVWDSVGPALEPSYSTTEAS